MTQRSATHASFTIERQYPAAPRRVFQAWADPQAKARWSGAPDATFDFRVGGCETNRGGPSGRPIYSFSAVYRDIVPDERIVYSYDMLMDDTRISVSLATVEFRPDGTGTRLLLTEQGVFLDGHDQPADRERGTHDLLDALGQLLERERTTEDAHGS